MDSKYALFNCSTDDLIWEEVNDILAEFGGHVIFFVWHDI